MALVIPPGFWQATTPLRNEHLLRPAVITFGVSEEDPERAPQDLADAIFDAFMLGFQDRLDPSVTVGPVSIFSYQAGGEGGSVDGTESGPGTRSTNNAIPPQVAAIIRKRTVRAGRAGRGRFYLPWCLDRDDVQENGQIEGGERNALQTAADGFLAALVAADAPMHILHDDNISGVTNPNEVTSLTVESQTGTQRRRNRA